MEANPPSERKEAREEGSEGEAEEEALAERPEDKDDVDGWVAFLSENPDDEEAAALWLRAARIYSERLDRSD